MAKIKPLQDRVLVRRFEGEEKTASGIYIPDSAKEKPLEGKVIAVGEGRTLDNGSTLKMTVKIGDKVLFGAYAGTPVTIDAEDYLIMREDDLLGIINN